MKPLSREGSEANEAFPPAGRGYPRRARGQHVCCASPTNKGCLLTVLEGRRRPGLVVQRTANSLQPAATPVVATLALASAANVSLER